MKRFKSVLLLSLLVMTSFASNALIGFDNYVLAKEPNRPCWLIETEMYSIDGDGYKFKIGSSQAWIGDCDCKIVTGAIDDCPPVDAGGYMVYTMPGSPQSIGAILNTEENIAAYLASLQPYIVANKQSLQNGFSTPIATMKVYPNPSKTSITVESAIKNYTGAVWIKVNDLSGRLVFSGPVSQPTSGSVTVDVSSFVSGTYVVSIGDQEKVHCTQKVFIRK